jgi:hypothetical protein
MEADLMKGLRFLGAYVLMAAITAGIALLGGS